MKKYQKFILESQNDNYIKNISEEDAINFLKKLLCIKLLLKLNLYQNQVI
jgi:hypothetical protein